MKVLILKSIKLNFIKIIYQCIKLISSLIKIFIRKIIFDPSISNILVITNQQYIILGTSVLYLVKNYNMDF